MCTKPCLDDAAPGARSQENRVAAVIGVLPLCPVCGLRVLRVEIPPGNRGMIGPEIFLVPQDGPHALEAADLDFVPVDDDTPSFNGFSISHDLNSTIGLIHITDGGRIFLSWRVVA